MVVRSLLHLSVTAVCNNNLFEEIAYMPSDIKEHLLEFFASHGLLALPSCTTLVSQPYFGVNLTRISFFLSEDITDSILESLTEYNKNVQQICLVECDRITDKGIQAVTAEQRKLAKLELRVMKNITGAAFSNVKSERLNFVDISGCSKITSSGVRDLVSWNRNISQLFLNNCRSLTDQAFYAIAFYLADKLIVLEIDFLNDLHAPAATLAYLSAHCPNLSQLSLARFFHQFSEDDEESSDVAECKIDSFNLTNVDLYENFFVTLPRLPATIQSIRISLTGDEDILSLISTLNIPQLKSINMQLCCPDASLHSIDKANYLLCTLIPYIGSKITTLQIAVGRLFDSTLTLITECLPNLKHLSFYCEHFNNRLMQKYFTAGSQGCKLRTLKIGGMRISYRVLFAIARGAKLLTELETPHILSVDDRFCALVADNCSQLRCINLNGCKYVTDKGIAALARCCSLREVFIRATACTDAAISQLTQYCPELELLSYLDFSGKPKFSSDAVRRLQDSCIQRILC